MYRLMGLLSNVRYVEAVCGRLKLSRNGARVNDHSAIRAGREKYAAIEELHAPTVKPAS